MNAGKTPGAQLREAREAQGKTLSELARSTRIAVQQLEGLEADNYDRIAAPIYVKGFLKNYAQALGLDPAPLVADAEQILSGTPRVQASIRPAGALPEPVSEPPPAAPTPSSTGGLRPPPARRLPSPGAWLNRLRAIRLPVDRRLVLISATVGGILLLVLVLRGCAPGSGEAAAPDGHPGVVPVSELENLLIATPEPILFELPRDTP